MNNFIRLYEQSESNNMFSDQMKLKKDFFSDFQDMRKVLILFSAASAAVSCVGVRNLGGENVCFLDSLTHDI